MADELVQINTGIKRLVKLIENSTIVDKQQISEMRKTREFAERERDEKGRFIKKEQDIQTEKADTTEKQTKFLKASFSDWKKQKEEAWKQFKQQNVIFRLSRAFWQSEAGQAIKNAFGRVKAVFNNIMGEIGEFFENMWSTVKDSFNFVKGTFGSLINSLRGGSKKERREKDQAKDIKKIKENLTRRQRRALLKKDKKGKKGGIIDSILGFLMGGTRLLAALPGLGMLLGIGAIVGSIGMAIFKGVQSYLAGNTAGQIIADAFKGLFTITRIAGSWIGKLVDLIFGTNIEEWFKKQNWDKFFDKYIGESIDWIVETVGGFIKDIVDITLDIITGEFQKRMQKKVDALYDWLDEKFTFKFMGKEVHLMDWQKETDPKKLEEQMAATERMYKQATQVPGVPQMERKKTETEKQKLKALQEIQKNTGKNLSGWEGFIPPIGNVSPAIPIPAPDTASQLQNNN